jgi:mRNA interferase RelE/StbE
MYAVEFLPSAARAFAKLDRAVQRRLAQRIDRLAREPRQGDVRMLRGADDVWRLRVGDYRVLYRIEDDRLVILVVKIGHRRDVYR